MLAAGGSSLETVKELPESRSSSHPAGVRIGAGAVADETGAEPGGAGRREAGAWSITGFLESAPSLNVPLRRFK
jgi:hypothetical protein